MALLHNMSDECIKSELDLFSLPMTQTSIEKSTYIEIPPLSALTDGGPIEFFVSASSEDYIDLNNTYLHLRIKITNPDGTDLAPAAPVGLINYPGCTLFSQVDITLGDRLITQSSNTYPYRGIIECLLNYGNGTLDTQFGCGLFQKDTHGHMDDILPGGLNLGLTTRSEYTGRSRIVELISPIHVDMFFQEKLLINGVDLRMRFIRAKNNFCLMSDGAAEYRVSIVSANVFIKKVSIAPGIKLAHARALNQANVKYPVDRVCLKNVSIAAGSRICTQDNLFLGQIPKMVIIGFVNNEAFTGSYARNPFSFQHFGIEFLSLYCDGQAYPAKPFQPDFRNGLYTREFFQLIQATGRQLKDREIAINHKEFGDGYALFCFNLEADEGCGQHVSLVRTGNVRLEARFRAALATTVNLICYAVYDSVIEISNRRQVLLDYY